MVIVLCLSIQIIRCVYHIKIISLKFFCNIYKNVKPSRIENRETVREIYVKLEIERINEIKELKQANNKRIKITKNRKSK